MKVVGRLLGLVILAGLAFIGYRAFKQYREDNVFELGQVPGGNAETRTTGTRSISPELLAILADPGDKGPVELVHDTDGKEWLINRRNGYRYPVEDGIPIMLIEEGEKHRDPRMIIA